MSLRRMGFCLALAASVAGCASTPALMNEPVSPLSLAEVRSDRTPTQGQKVRWGGVIAAVENRNSETWLELVEQPLDRRGRPQMVDRSGGRFMAKVPGFLEPSIYTKGRELTVVGAVDGRYRSTIGKEYHYEYPVVAVSAYQLWEPRIERDTYYIDGAYPWGWPGYHRPYGWYDPFWHGPSYRVDVRRRGNQPGPGPAPAAGQTPLGQPTPAPAPREPVRERDPESRRDGVKEP
ncbi:MAG: Slp family lipoprotein [Gammaproteobacteria bacterium]|nr:Slp family lipoprotein [Gammaproteobacteria bacterium]